MLYGVDQSSPETIMNQGLVVGYGVCQSSQKTGLFTKDLVVGYNVGQSSQ